MNIIKEIHNLLEKIEDEIGEENINLELNIKTDMKKSSKIKEKLINDAGDKYVHKRFDNECWVSMEIGKLDIGIWHS